MIGSVSTRRTVVLGAAAVVLFSAAAADASAQQATLVGTVRASATAEPLHGAQVEVVEAGRRVETDAAGAFRVERLAPGVYTVRAVVPGRAARTERVAVEAGGATVVDLALDVAPYQLAAVNVLLDRTRMVDGRLSPIAGSAHHIDAQAIRRSARAVDDVHALLRMVPGVNVQEEDGYGLRPNIGMRGTGVERSSKVSLMEDGVPIAPAPYAAPAAYVFPLVGRMEAIEVRKGSSQVKYGPWTTGGAINFVTTSIPATLRTEADVTTGTNGTKKLRATAGDSYRHFGWLAETYQLETDGFKRLDAGVPTGFELRDWFVKLRANTDPDARRAYHELELKLTRADETSHETYLGLTEADFRASPLHRYAASQEDVMDVAQRKYALRHFFRPTGARDVTTTVYHHDFSRSWYKLDAVAGRSLAAVLDDPTRYAAELALLRGESSEADALRVRANNRVYESRGVQTVLGARFATGGARHALELGARLHRDSEDRFQHDDAYRMVIGRMELTRAGAPGTQANRVNAARALALFVEDQITLGAWTLAPGVRFESIRFSRDDYAAGDAARATPAATFENGVDVLIPGVGVVRELGAGLVAFGGVHKGFGPPGPGADEQARAEESVNYELGVRYHRGWANAQIVAFHNDYANILGRATAAVGESGSGDLFNGGRVRTRGLEIAADYDAAARLGVAARVPLSVAYTFTDARFRSDFESSFDSWGSVVAGDRLPYLPQHQLRVGAALERNGWSVRAAATHASAMRTRAGQGPIAAGEGTDAFVVFDAAGELRLLQNARVFAGIQNITDERYVVARRPAGARPGMPRSIAVGVRLAK